MSVNCGLFDKGIKGIYSDIKELVNDRVANYTSDFY